ncbi:hypothetical protein OB920_07665 [Halobacteria archaeon HArc-gm2]|nr:hypothetical protein [Halobacteria archaeon HArc-gm2]
MNDLDAKFHHIGVGSVNDGSDSPVVKYLYENGFILCHYEDVISFDPKDYDGDTGDLEPMVDAIRDDSSYLCYVRLARGHGSDGTRQLGRLEAKSEPQIIAARETNHKSGNNEVEGFEIQEFPESELEAAKQELNSDAWKIYKGAQLTAVKQLSPEEHTGLSEVPFTTWSNWDPAEQVFDLYEGNNLNPRDPRSFSPPQTERLCEEFLRLVRPNYCPLVEPGGSHGTGDLDLIGFDDRTRVLGEVKNTTSPPSESDLNAVATQSRDPNTDAYLFTRTPPENDYPEVIVINLSTVIETLHENQRTRKLMERMVSHGSSLEEDASE